MSIETEAASPTRFQPNFIENASFKPGSGEFPSMPNGRRPLDVTSPEPNSRIVPAGGVEDLIRSQFPSLKSLENRAALDENVSPFKSARAEMERRLLKALNNFVMDQTKFLARPKFENAADELQAVSLYSRAQNELIAAQAAVLHELDVL